MIIRRSLSLYDRIAHLEVHINVIDGGGSLVVSSANGSLIMDKKLTRTQVRRIKEAVDAICELGRQEGDDKDWSVDIGRM